MPDQRSWRPTGEHLGDKLLSLVDNLDIIHSGLIHTDYYPLAWGNYRQR